MRVAAATFTNAASRYPQVSLENRQIPLQLPFRELHAVLVPLLALELDIALEDVVAERFAHELGLRELLDRLAERFGQRDDPALAPLVGGQVVEVGLHRWGQLVALLDPLEPRMEQRREGQI